MKKIVVYYSLNGATRFVAEKIAAATNADILELNCVKEYPKKGFMKFFIGGRAAIIADKPQLKPYTCNIDDYDLFILATPVWVGLLVPPLNSFLAQNDISAKKIALVATCDGRGADKIFEKVKETYSNVVATLCIAKPLNDKEKTQSIINDFSKQIDE